MVFLCGRIERLLLPHDLRIPTQIGEMNPDVNGKACHRKVVVIRNSAERDIVFLHGRANSRVISHIQLDHLQAITVVVTQGIMQLVDAIVGDCYIGICMLEDIPRTCTALQSRT